MCTLVIDCYYSSDLDEHHKSVSLPCSPNHSMTCSAVSLSLKQARACNSFLEKQYEALGCSFSALMVGFISGVVSDICSLGRVKESVGL